MLLYLKMTGEPPTVNKRWSYSCKINYIKRSRTRIRGTMLVKQAAIKTAEKAGDGTTTSTLLAREMVKGGLNALNNNENAVAN